MDSLLDKTGFLDKIVDGIISESGHADWINESQRFGLKIELGKELEDRFSGMDWSEVFEFVLELSIKIKSEALGPMEFDPEKQSDSVINKLRQTMGDHLNEIGEKVAGADRK